MLIPVYVKLCEYMHDIYTHTYFQQTNWAEGITKYHLHLKAKNIVYLGELLKRHLFQELGIQGA